MRVYFNSSQLRVQWSFGSRWAIKRRLGESTSDFDSRKSMCRAALELVSKVKWGEAIQSGEYTRR